MLGESHTRESTSHLWLRGGFPGESSRQADEASAIWRADAVNHYLYSDLRQLGMNVAALVMMRFWQMVALYQTADLECRRAGTVSRRRRDNCSQVSGLPDSDFHDSPVAAPT